MSKDYFYPLKKSVNILITDDDPHQIDIYESMLSLHPLYNVHTASNAREAEAILQSTCKIHLCTLDLGINDLKSDEYYLLKKYSPKIPFVIISGSNDIERAYTASMHGAAGVLAKPVSLTDNKYWETLHSAFLNYKILPSFPTGSNPLLNDCLQALQSADLESVSEWAATVNVTDSYLRKIWSKHSSSSPKMILFLYKFYKEAFKWFDAQSVSALSCQSNLTPPPDVSEHRKFLNYYLQNKAELDTIRDGI